MQPLVLEARARDGLPLPFERRRDNCALVPLVSLSNDRKQHLLHFVKVNF